MYVTYLEASSYIKLILFHQYINKETVEISKFEPKLFHLVLEPEGYVEGSPKKKIHF